MATLTTSPTCLRTAGHAYPVAVPAAVAADLQRLAARVGEGASRVAAILVAAHFAAAQADGPRAALGDWLDRLFEFRHDDPQGRTRLHLHLPAWQVAALREAADVDGVGQGVVLAAMIARPLRQALARRGEPLDACFTRAIAEQMVAQRA